MPHISTPEAEALLDVPLPMYDGQGFVKLIDWMGGDKRVVDACRVSNGEKARTFREDQGLINYCMENGHTSPFEKLRFEFYVEGLMLPIRTQWIRHRMASYNERSARFAEVEDDAFMQLKPENIRRQSNRNKQAGEGVADHAAAEAFVRGLSEVETLAKDVYKTALAAGIEKGQARLVLPQNMQSGFYLTIDFHNLCHLLKLRLAWDAQGEWKEPATLIAQCVKAIAPMCYEAFEEYHLHAVKLSRTETRWVRDLLNAKVFNDPAGHERISQLLDTFISVEGVEQKQANKLFDKLGVKQYETPEHEPGVYISADKFAALPASIRDSIIG